MVAETNSPIADLAPLQLVLQNLRSLSYPDGGQDHLTYITENPLQKIPLKPNFRA